MLQEDDINYTENQEEALVNRRRHLRSVFTYPVEFKFLSRRSETISFVGYLKDISLGGASLEIEDPYGRLNINEAKNGKIVLTLSIPREDKTNIQAHVQWIKRKEGAFRTKMGISFRDIDYKDATVIERLIGLKSKDHNMMWNLWEQYYR